ncbi:MAG: hypothetical protein H7257_04395 [Taibaiella sp.]|nr:hypothetical protein [Taibaiella sp.]
MKMLLAYFFIFLFLCSVLPIREIGKLCCKAQSSEEVHSDDCDNGDDDCNLCKLKKEVDPFTVFSASSIVSAVNVYGNKIQVAIHQTSILPDHFVPNIPTRPPDFC